MSDLVGNPKDRFSRVEAHFQMVLGVDIGHRQCAVGDI